MHFNAARRMIRAHGFEFEAYRPSAGGFSAFVQYEVCNPETCQLYLLSTEEVKEAGDQLMALTGGTPPANCPKPRKRTPYPDGFRPL